jgi:hypothetical protein
MSEANEQVRAKAPKVTVRESTGEPKGPVDRKTAEIVDALGRTLKVRKISALTRYRVAKVLGPDNSTNLGLLGMALACVSVTEIDGEAVFPPAQEIELEALLQRLDEEGLEAVNLAYIANGWNQSGIDPAALKNS